MANAHPNSNTDIQVFDVISKRLVRSRTSRKPLEKGNSAKNDVVAEK